MFALPRVTLGGVFLGGASFFCTYIRADSHGFIDSSIVNPELTIPCTPGFKKTSHALRKRKVRGAWVRIAFSAKILKR